MLGREVLDTTIYIPFRKETFSFLRTFPTLCPRVCLSQLQRKPHPESLSEARRRHTGAPRAVVRRGALRLAVSGHGSGMQNGWIAFYTETTTRAHILRSKTRDSHTTVNLRKTQESPPPDLLLPASPLRALLVAFCHCILMCTIDSPFPPNELPTQRAPIRRN